MLRELFTEFDKMCQKHEVYKVYTIGDCYVVMGFVNAMARNPRKEAINVVRMGLAMINIIREVRKKINFNELDMRIGIHTVFYYFFFLEKFLNFLLFLGRHHWGDSWERYS